AAATGIAAAAAVIVVNAVSMVGGELVPKNVSLADPLAAAARVAGVQRAFTTAVRPAIWVLNGSANLVLRPFGVTPSEELSGARSAKELESLVKTSAEAGTLDRPLAGRLMGTLSLRELTAIDAMTDRTAVRTVARQATIEDAVRAARDSGHSTLPVTDGSKDVIVGLLRLRRAVAVPYESRGRVRVGAIMTPAPSVPETAPLGPVMVALRDAGAPMAVVVDEYGGTSGIVTLEDVVEEIVGEVADEHDGRTAAARPLPDGDWRVSGRLRPDELEELTGVRVPESHLYETLGGAVMAAIGRIPRAGDEAVVGGVRLRVEAVRRRRVEALRVSPPAPADGAAAEEADRP
ncbi:MAG: hemolysin family protein, partial [Bifidobacteriaceae bacterium]|nr:hemolysin family protein [Bifidobacteriaceae bacterium]